MRQLQRPLWGNWLFPYMVFLASMLLALVPLAAAQAAGQTTARSSKALADPPPAIIFGPGKSHVTQDANWVQAKLAHLVVRQGQTITILSVSPLGVYPSSYLLSSAANYTYEPPPSGYDSHGAAYTDGYYANFCAAGASTVALFYWDSGNRETTWPAGTFTEPSKSPDPGQTVRQTSTYWNDTDNRAYLMYLAEQVLVPGWSIPGEVSFDNYSYAYTATGDLQNTLNWEASNHGSNWQSFFYITVGAGSLSASQLNSDVMGDVYGSGVPLVAITNTVLQSLIPQMDLKT